MKEGKRETDQPFFHVIISIEFDSLHGVNRSFIGGNEWQDVVAEKLLLSK